MSEWQPIETAPRDGADILCFQPGLANPISVCAWVVGWNGEGVWEIGDEYVMEPTHWQPLPAPPALAKES